MSCGLCGTQSAHLCARGLERHSGRRPKHKLNTWATDFLGTDFRQRRILEGTDFESKKFCVVTTSQTGQYEVRKEFVAWSMPSCACMYNTTNTTTDPTEGESHKRACNPSDGYSDDGETDRFAMAGLHPASKVEFSRPRLTSMEPERTPPPPPPRPNINSRALSHICDALLYRNADV